MHHAKCKTVTAKPDIVGLSNSASDWKTYVCLTQTDSHIVSVYSLSSGWKSTVILPLLVFIHRRGACGVTLDRSLYAKALTYCLATSGATAVTVCVWSSPLVMSDTNGSVVLRPAKAIQRHPCKHCHGRLLLTAFKGSKRDKASTNNFVVQK